MIRLALLLLMLSAVPSRADAPGPTFGSRSRFTEAGGEAIYAAACAGCHMADGRGAVGAGRYPALAGNEHLADAAYPIALVLHGAGAMPLLRAHAVGRPGRGGGRLHPLPPRQRLPRRPHRRRGCRRALTPRAAEPRRAAGRKEAVLF